MPLPRRIALPALLLMLALCAGGCSLTELAYGFADRLIVRKLDQYLGLTKAQEARALELARARLRLHHRDELPRYIHWLEDARAAFVDGLTAGEIRQLDARAGELWRLAVKRSLPGFAELLADLAPEQRAYFGEQVGKRFTEAAERIAERQAQEGGETRENTEAILAALEDWLGELSAEQRAIVVRHVAAWPNNDAAWLAWRRERFRDFHQALLQGVEPPELERRMARAWLHNADMPESLRRQWEHIRRDYFDMLLELDATLGAAQRRHALARADELLATLRSLKRTEVD